MSEFGSDAGRDWGNEGKDSGEISPEERRARSAHVSPGEMSEIARLMSQPLPAEPRVPAVAKDTSDKIPTPQIADSIPSTPVTSERLNRTQMKDIADLMSQKPAKEE